jgi:hypothetical protein
MHNYLDDPVPDDPILRIHHFARDLAYGVMAGDWYINIDDIMSFPRLYRDVEGYEKLAKKWEETNSPDPVFLDVYGYVDRSILTQKAFDLLNQSIPASIFISYSRKDSSAFALLLLARFKAIGMEPFLDMKDLKPGDEWHGLLQEEIRNRDYFVCLIGPHTLESPYVLKEIQWALDASARTIPIWHSGFRFQPEASHPEWLTEFMQRNAIIVEQENTKAYEGALIELFNYFGFTPS